MQEDSATGKESILVVDDNPANLRLVVGILSAQSYRVCVATSGERALEAVAAETPDLILLDVAMPGMSGYDVCRRLKANPKTAAISVIFVSAASELGSQIAGFECGGVDYVVKPIQELELLARVKTHLKTRRLQRDLERLNQSLESTVTLRTQSLVESNLLLKQKNDFLHLHQLVTAAVNASPHLEIAVRHVLKLVAVHTDWNIGHIYLPSLEAPHSLRSTGFLYVDEPQSYTRLAGLAANRAANDGLARLACSRNQLYWSDDLFGSQSSFEIAAADSGLLCSVVIPVPVGNEITAVVELFSKQPHPQDEGLTEVLTDIGIQLGRVIERRRAKQEQYTLEVQVRESQKLESLGLLAGGIAHDFNNILQGILGYAELSLLSLSPSDSAYPTIKNIQKAGEQAGELVKQIVGFSRRDPGLQEHLNVDVLLADTMTLVRAATPSFITIEEDYRGDLGAVFANSTQIQQVLLNLCTNAAHAMNKDGGRLTISARVETLGADSDQDLPAGPYLLIQVRDSGVGMDATTRARIFEPLFTTKAAGKGTGLGLATVINILSHCGGAITVESDLGVGTTFRVYIPTSESAKTVAAGPEFTSGRQVGRVLFVDDDPDIAEIGKRYLERVGYEVVATTDAKSALEIITDSIEEFDIVISDMMMPGLTGKELAREIHNLKPKLPIILMSGTHESYQNHFAELGIRAFMPKPLQLTELVDTLERLINTEPVETAS